MSENNQQHKEHRFKIKVLPKDIDRLNHVNNVVYLKWINEASERHWKILSNSEIDQKYFWVAVRHEIDYLKPAFLGEELEVRTWIGKTGGVRSIRHVEIYRGDNLLAKSQTTWCLMDVVSGKITRIGEEIMRLLY